VKSRVFLLLTCLLAGGCGNDDDSYLPLPSPGTLTYGLTETTSGETREQKRLTSIDGPVVIDGREVYREFTASGPQRLLQRREDGIQEVGYYRSARPSFRESPILILPQPLGRDCQWRAPLTTRLLEWRKHTLENAGRRFRTRLLADFRCETMDDRVKTPAGTFGNVARITASARKTVDYGSIQEQTVIHVELTRWYAPGIGLVKSERREHADSRELNPGESKMILERID